MIFFFSYFLFRFLFSYLKYLLFQQPFNHSNLANNSALVFFVQKKRILRRIEAQKSRSAEKSKKRTTGRNSLGSEQASDGGERD